MNGGVSVSLAGCGMIIISLAIRTDLCSVLLLLFLASQKYLHGRIKLQHPSSQPTMAVGDHVEKLGIDIKTA